MARIIYGVAGQGFGHSARSFEVLNHLKKKGHTLLVLTYGQATAVMKPHFPVLEIPGLGLNYQNNRVVYWRTIYDNARMLMRNTKNWPRLLRTVRKFKPDLIISDFEPLSTALAHLNKLPLVSFNNQHQLTNTKISIPPKYRRDFLATKLIVKSMVWGADYYLITSFFKTEVTHPRTFLFPPVVREPVRRLRPTIKNFTLVYQNSDFDYIIDELKKLAPERFIIFSTRPFQKTEGNITFKNHEPKEFLKDLKSCKAIIATAGSSLAFEALWLKKPYFAIPVAQQVEQTINALYIKKLGFGDWAVKFTAPRGKKFLSNLKFYRSQLKKQPNLKPTELFKKLDSIINSLS